MFHCAVLCNLGIVDVVLTGNQRLQMIQWACKSSVKLMFGVSTTVQAVDVSEIVQQATDLGMRVPASAAAQCTIETMI